MAQKPRKKFSPRGRNSDVANQNKEKEEMRRAQDPKPNDPKWYTLDGALSRDVGSIVFNRPLGKALEFIDSAGTVKKVQVPGIATIYTVPSIGKCDMQNDPFNVAGFNIYTWLRTKISGTRSYDPADLMFYLQAMDSAYSYLAFMTRAYGIARVYSGVNRYVGDAMLQATGINPADLRKNLANYRAYINSYITKLSAFIVPKTMHVFEKHFNMYNQIYMDFPIAKSQFYMYVPAMLWKYEEAAAGPRLRHAEVIGFWDTDHIGFGTVDYEGLIERGNNIINALMSSEDCATISGDLLRAYEGEVWRLSPLAEDTACVPIYSEEMLVQIHNTKFIGTYILAADGTPSIEGIEPYQQISETENFVRWYPMVKKPSTLTPLDFYATCDVPYDNPSVEDVMVATRNLVSAFDGGTYIAIDACGTELCLDVAIWEYNTDGTTLIPNEYLKDSTGVGSLTGLARMDKFNMFPNIPLFGGSTPTISGDLYNPVVLSDAEVYNLHNSALISLYGVPLLGQTVIVK